MSRMELIKEYIKTYISDNNITGDDIHRLYNEVWEVCKESVSCNKSMFIDYMMN